MGEAAKITSNLMQSSALQEAANQLLRLAELAADIDDAVGDWLVSAEPGRLPTELLQSVDLMRQRAACLEIVMRNISQMSHEDAPIDLDALLEGVYLAETRQAFSLHSK